MVGNSTFDERMTAYESSLIKLRFTVGDDNLVLGKWLDVGATYVKASARDERIWVVSRPLKGAKYEFVSLNPAAAFDLANAILAEGARTGWFSVDSVDGEAVPKVRH